MISQCKLIMLFLLGGDHEQDLSKFGNSWHIIDVARFYPKEAYFEVSFQFHPLQKVLSHKTAT
jgi:hypothetical protein